MRVKHHEIAATTPSVFIACDQILHLVWIGSLDRKAFDRDVSKPALGIERIEVN
jgi:hypothetical protein